MTGHVIGVTVGGLLVASGLGLAAGVWLGVLIGVSVGLICCGVLTLAVFLFIVDVPRPVHTGPDPRRG